MSTATYRVSGMTCHHCVRAVKDEIGALAGVTAVEVDLVEDGLSTVSVTSASPLDEAAVALAIDEAGYSLARPTIP
jgi:copper chaperone CopZ